MKDKKKAKRLGLKIFVAAVLMCCLVYFVYFPGRQAVMALSLASGLGIPRIQAEVDRLEAKAIKNADFTAAGKHYLRALFSCFAKGGRLTIVLRQTGAIMDHYLSSKGTPYKTGTRIFLKNKKVQGRMAGLRKRVLDDFKKTGKVRDEYSTPTFYLPDPSNLDSMFGLYYGRLLVRPKVVQGGRLRLEWRAEVPWEWPTYESQIKEYKNPHAKHTRVPNALSLIKGKAFGLLIDDGLGEYLVRLGLAKPFLLYGEWEELI